MTATAAVPQSRPRIDAPSEVRAFDVRAAIPGDCSLRLDQPCLREHGSLGGWRLVDGVELAFTLLWRPLRYWAPSPEPDATASTATIAELQAGFVEHALARTRRDGLAVEVLAHTPTALSPGGHDAELLDIALGVRRRLARLRLRRRQVLWTCPDSGRHLAFEVSARWSDRELVDAAFEAMTPTLGCHGGTRVDG